MQRTTNTLKYDPAVLFPNGVNSYLDPQLLATGQVRWAVNAVCKGAIWQTRPGYKTKYTFDTVNNGVIRDWYLSLGQPFIVPQFMRVVNFGSDTPYLLFGVSGTVFQCTINPDLSLTLPQVVANLQFDRTVTQIVTTVCVKSSDIIDGVKTPVDPYQVVIIQDGITRAGYWSTRGSGHLNPTKNWTQNDAGDTLYTAGYNQTPLGKWMAWSGNRLWVAVRNQVYASDLNDPINFTESITLVNVPVLNFPEDVTGLHDRGITGSNSSYLFVFTSKSTHAVFSGVQDRSKWTSTADFQVKIYDGVGCVAGKSIVAHRGILHWYSNDGIVSHDTINTAYSTQSLPPIDSEMAVSKAVMSTDRNAACCGFRDSYVFWSVPATPPVGGRQVNGHTQVLDKTVIPVQASGTGISAWQGIWTGINPVEWCTDQVAGKPFTWALSMDHDGKVRIWEAFQGNRSDNGRQIPWSVETKTHLVADTPFSNRSFKHFRAQLTQIRGNLSMRGYWRGTRGQYHKLLDTQITSTPGSILIPNPLFTPFTKKTQSYNCRKQARIVISEDVRGTNDENDAVDVENKYTDSIDSAFSLLFRFFGVGALRAYWIASDVFADNTEGEVQEPESGIRVLPEPSVVDPFTVEGPTPDYVLGDDTPQAAFNPVDTVVEEEEYHAIPVDDPSTGVIPATPVPLEDVLTYSDFRLWNPAAVIVTLPDGGTATFFVSSSVNDGVRRTWTGSAGAGMYFLSSGASNAFNGVLTGWTGGQVNYRVAGGKIIYDITPPTNNFGPDLPAP